MEIDSTLLSDARTMNKDALVKVFDLYSAALYNYALHLCGDPVTADHIVGDVFAKLLDQLSSGKGPSVNLRSYLYEITYHRVIDEVRYLRRRVPLEVADWLAQGSDPAFLRLEDQILFKQIVDAIRNELTADQRHVIILRFLEEFSLRETAAILGKHVSHVKVIQGRALAKLRRALEYRGMRKAMSSVRNGSVPNTVGI